MIAHFPVSRFTSYVVGNFAVAIAFLGVWTVLLRLDSALIPLMILSFPVLVIIGLAFLWSLNGWKQVVPGIVSWLIIWAIAYTLGLMLLDRIAGPS